jgi:cytochrome c oxidase subunit II
MMQSTVLIITLVLMAVVAFVFIQVVRSVKAESGSVDTDTRRSRFIWALIVVGIVVTTGSLREWPHAIASGNDVFQVNATAGQWYWEIDKQKVPLGKTVVFNLNAKDVNHGFGVMDSSGTLLLQTQAMPGYINRVQYVFDKPGKYRVVCMEFCGIGHHAMIDEFEVVAN